MALAAVTASGCADNEATFFIRQMSAPLVAGNLCTLPIDPTAQRVTEGVMDVGLRDDYFVAPLFQSSLISTANPSFGRVETAGVNIQGFVVELRDGSPSGALLERPFSVYQSTFVPAGVGGLPTYAATQLQVIPPPVGQALRASVCVVDRTGVDTNCPVPRIRQRVKRVIVRMYAFGRTQGNLDIETPIYDFPVNVCCGCLVQFPADADAPETVRPGPDCTVGVPLVGPGQCGVGMDFPVDCRSCAGTNREFCQPRGYRATVTQGAMGMPMSIPCPTDP